MSQHQKDIRRWYLLLAKKNAQRIMDNKALIDDVVADIIESARSAYGYNLSAEEVLAAAA